MIADAFPAEYGTFIFHVTPDLGIFAYVFCVSLLAGVLFGLAPALESSGAALSSALKASSSTGKVRSRRMRNFLMAAQVAVSLMLLIAGSMLTRSSIRALKMDTGYDSEHVVSLELCDFQRGRNIMPTVRLPLSGSFARGWLPCLAWLRSPVHGRRTATVSNSGCFAEWRKTLATKYASDPLLHLCSAELLSNAGHSAAVRARISNASRPA